jgi:filamentous hemagglutinin family protein
MNHIYLLTWNASLQQYVPTPETARGQHKGGKTKRKLIAAAVAAALISGTSGVLALPIGGQVSSGTGSVTSGGATLTVNQSSQNLALNWQSFNIAGNETVNFVQPNASAIALNRVLGSDPSAIYGKLNANGQVFLLNPNGILFGAGAEVNVGGLVASTLNLSDADFMSGKRTFTGGSSTADSAVVTNLGSIAANGGYIAFLGGKVSNQGTLQANLGTVALAAGNQTTLDFAGDKLIKVQVDQGALNALAANGQLIQADGGTVILTAKAANSLVSAVVNNTGLIQAQTLTNHAGVISLLGDMQNGAVNVGGTLDASAPNGGNGGFIDTSAAHVNVANDAIITTAAASGLAGTWLIDPQDFTVAASGGDITGAALGSNLGATNVTLQSSSGAAAGSGNVNVNDTVTWSANTTLTLTASNNVNINGVITATGAAAGLVINPNTANGAETASGTGTYTLGAGATINLQNVSPTSTTALVIAGMPYTVINSLGVAGDMSKTTLQGINGNPAGNYALGSNLDATATATWNGKAGFTPLGNSYPVFIGTFDGLGHTITGLTINAPSDYVGLFSVVGVGGVVRNVGLVGGSVNSLSYCVGALAGDNSGTIVNAAATGSVGGGEVMTGGLVGFNQGTIINASASGNVSGSGDVGGLVGRNFSTITNATASGNVSGSGNIGGLVGDNWSTKIGDNWTTISNVTATGNVSSIGSSGNIVGGLVGANSGIIGSAYATGIVSGSGEIGGLVGDNWNAISNAYATGSVSGSGSSSNIGGLAGSNSGTISTSYATGSVSGNGSTAAGGLVGSNSGTVDSSFWNITTSGLTSSPGGTGLTTVESQTQSSYHSWDFTHAWVMYDGYTAPLLRAFMTPLTVTANSASMTYDGQAYSAADSVTYSITPNANLLGAVSFVGTAQGAVNVKASNYTIIPTGLYSMQQQGGYAIDFVNGTLTINPAPLTVVGTAVANKVYDGTTTATLSGGTLNGVVAGDTVTLTQSGTFVTKNVNMVNGAPAAVAVTVTDTPGGSAAGNYALVEPAGLSAVISPLALSVSGQTGAANKVYDGTTTATMTANLFGVVSGDKVALLGNFSDANVSAGKTVTYGNSLTGTDAGNYTLPAAGGTTTSDITPAPLTVVGTAAANKVYDGMTATALTGGTLSGLAAGDSITLIQSGAFASANAGTGIAVTAADSLSGSPVTLGNYTFTAPTGLTANITPKALTLTGTLTAANKVYDSTTAATVTCNLTTTCLSGVVNSDDVNFSSGTFATPNVGANIPVTAILGGATAGNYTIATPTGLAANITPAPVTVSGTTVVSGPYNGTTTATLQGGTLNGVMPSDAGNVPLMQSGVFASQYVGTNIPVTVTNSLGGTSASNYALAVSSQVQILLGDILPLTSAVTGNIAESMFIREPLRRH